MSDQRPAPDVRNAELSSARKPSDEVGGNQLNKLDRPWLILCLLFFVTAALGLPMVWFSHSFSRPAKLLLTLVVSLYTIVLLSGFALLMVWCYHRISSSL